MTRGARSGVLGVVSRRVYHILLLAYPRSFREAHGDDAARLFADTCVDSWNRHGAWAVVRRLGHALAQVPRQGLADRRAARRGHRASGRARSRVQLPTDVRYALRSLARRPGLNLAIITTLALGIGANTAMFSVIDATLLRPLPYPNADRVVYLRARMVAEDRGRNPTAEELARWAPLVQAFERVEGAGTKSARLQDGQYRAQVRMLGVTAGYLDALDVRPIAGRLLHAADYRPDAAPVVVLAEELWRTRYEADRAVVGRPLTVDGVNRVVVGVAAHRPNTSSALYLPLPDRGPEAAAIEVRGIVWLRPGVSLEAARDELGAVSRSLDASGREVVGLLQPPDNLFWEIPPYRDSQLMLLAAVFVLLAIAGVNVTNLLLASGRTRRGELAVRSALGAGRGHLVRLLVIESLVLSLAGCAIGVLVAWGGLELFAALGYDGRWQEKLNALRLDGFVVGYAVAIALVTGLVAGLVPALRGSDAAPAAIIKDHGAGATSGYRRLRAGLVTAEIALSVVLLVAAGLIGRAFVRMHSTDPGFDADRVLSVMLSLPEDRYPTAERRATFYDALLADARRLPGVVSAVVAYGGAPPAGYFIDGEIDAGGPDTPPTEFGSNVTFTQPGYFDLMGIPLVAGRDFTAADGDLLESTTEMPGVISRQFAQRYWPDADPLGRTLRISLSGNRTVRIVIVGIVGNLRQQDQVDASAYAQHLYLPLLVDRRWTDVLLRTTEGTPPPIAGLREAIARLDPEIAVDDSLRTGAASLMLHLRESRFRAVVLGSLAALAVALAGFGIAAVVSYSVSRRRREMGIRLALGARPAQVRRLVLREGLMPVVLGLGLGVVAALALTRALASMLFDLSPSDAPTFVATTAVLMIVAIAAIWVPAARATRVDPTRTLRSE